MAKKKYVVFEGEEFELIEATRWQRIREALLWGTIASLLASVIVWVIGDFALPQSCEVFTEVVLSNYAKVP